MNYSKTEISNLAFSHFGASTIDAFDTDPSPSGLAARAYFPIAFETVTREHDWAWARKRGLLALVAEKPNVEWLYAHRLFADCLAPRRIASGQRLDDESSEIPFETGEDPGGGLLFSNVKTPELVYTALPADVTRLPADVVLAVSYKLAQLASGLLVREDPFAIAERMERLYMEAIDRAKVAALRDEKPGKMPAPSWLRARR